MQLQQPLTWNLKRRQNKLEPKCYIEPNMAGIITNEPMREYHASKECYGNSSLKDLGFKGPRYFKARHIDRTIEDKETSATIMGTQVHSMVLEFDTYLERYAVVPQDAPKYPSESSWKAKKSKPEIENDKTWWSNWESTHLIGNKTKVSWDKDQLVRGMRTALKDHPDTNALLWPDDKSKVHTELTFRTPRLKKYGFSIQCRTDFLNLGSCAITNGMPYVVDLKKCRSIGQFKRTFQSEWGYHRTAPFYTMVMNALMPGVDFRYLFIAIPDEPPHEPAIFEVDQLYYEFGQMEVARDMQMLANCLKTDEWPFFHRGVNQLSEPRWSVVERCVV